jgi:Domain of unknown function (DUF4349)
MKFTTLLFLAAIFLGLSGCDGARQSQSERASLAPDAERTKSSEATRLPEQAAVVARTEIASNLPVSLKDADAANAASQAFDRRIIRDANLTIEAASPLESQRKIFSIAESHGGFVVTSEMSQQGTEDKSKPQLSVNLVVRLPASQFEQAVDEIRATGNRILQEKRTGQDVTEEFIDLEARIKNQKALENQFLEIMKRAGKVSDALEVQTQLADVRTEIEKLEGRKRFLANQSSLSTINITLQTPAQIVNAVGFWYNVRSAFADGIDVAGAIILFLIRAMIALVPVLVFIVLPLALIAKFGLNVARRHRPSKPATVGATNE